MVRQNSNKIVDFGNEILINQLGNCSAGMLRKLARVNDVNTVMYSQPYAIDLIPTNVVRTRVRGNLRMRKQNTKTTVPLGVVPERRTERFRPRFRLCQRHAGRER